MEECLPINTSSEAGAEPRSPMFFPVSPAKLFVLSICTLGLYEVYWFYKNWQLIKRRESSDIVPALRAIFSIFFCYSLFQKVEQEAGKANDAPSIAAGPLAVGWIIVTILWRLPDPYWLVSFAAVLFMLPVQHVANAVNHHVAPDHDPNRRFSGWNIAAVVVGGLFLVLVVIGTFLPAE